MSLAPPWPSCTTAPRRYLSLVVATATSSPLPTLAREDRQRLTLFFKHGEDFALLADKLAEQLNAAEPSSPSDPSSPRPRVSACASPPQHSALSPQHSALDEFSLQTWASQPEIAAHIACRRAEADYRARKNAITFLEEVLRSTDNLIEKRRAASTILRILSRSDAPSGRGPNRPPEAANSRVHPADTRVDDQMPSCSSTSLYRYPTIEEAFTPKPGDITGPQTPLPDPTRTDDQLLDLVLSSLKDLNTPTRHTALLTLFNLSGRLNPRTPQAFKKFTYDIRRWLGWADPAQGWTYTSCTPLSRENLPDASTTILSIFIRHESFGTLANCSLLASVLAIRPGATRADSIPPDTS
jgi:hypothetical protein